MTETEQKALALWNAVRSKNHEPPLSGKRAALLCSPSGWESINRAIEQHEQFKRDVSDAVKRSIDDCGHDGMRKAHISSRLDRFILPKPVDPLVEIMDKRFGLTEDYAIELREALAARGLTITETKE